MLGGGGDGILSQRPSGDMGIGDGEKAIPYRVTPSSNIAPPGHRKGPGFFHSLQLFYLFVVWLVGGIQIRRKE